MLGAGYATIDGPAGDVASRETLMEGAELGSVHPRLYVVHRVEGALSIVDAVAGQEVCGPSRRAVSSNVLAPHVR